MTAEPPRQRLAIPAYFPPGPLWAQLGDAAGAVGLAIVNPASGPGRARSPAYAACIAASREKGVRVVGYVDTDYAARPPEAVRRDIARYGAWYGVDGIFLDQVGADPADLPYYAALSAAIRAGGARPLVVLNPGVAVPPPLMAAADIIVTFEDSYAVYTGAYRAPRWMRDYPAERICHLVHGVPTVTALRRVLALSRRRRAGWLYATPATLPNPWADLPPGPYWAEEVAAIGATRSCAPRGEGADT